MDEIIGAYAKQVDQIDALSGAVFGAATFFYLRFRGVMGERWFKGFTQGWALVFAAGLGGLVVVVGFLIDSQLRGFREEVKAGVSRQGINITDAKVHYANDYADPLQWFQVAHIGLGLTGAALFAGWFAWNLFVRKGEGAVEP